jgi:serine/threonine protein kinase
MSSTHNKIIGRGSYGIVKKYQKSKAIKEFTTELGLYTSTLIELSSYKYLSIYAPHIIPSFEILRDKNNYKLLMDRYTTDLYYIEADSVEYYRDDIFKQLLTYLCDWTEIGLCHRDFKPSNVVVRLLNEKLDLKVIDWGSSLLFNGIAEKGLNTHISTLWYRAPELFDKPESYDPQMIDVWSVGMSIVHLLDPKNKLNLRDGNINSLKSKIFKLLDEKPISQTLNLLYTKDSDLNSDLLNLLDQMMVINPLNRIKPSNIIKHKYLLPQEKKVKISHGLISNKEELKILYEWVANLLIVHSLKFKYYRVCINIINKYLEINPSLTSTYKLIAFSALSLIIGLTDQDYSALDISEREFDLNKLNEMRANIFDVINIFEFHHLNDTPKDFDNELFYSVQMLYILYTNYDLETITLNIENFYHHVMQAQELNQVNTILLLNMKAKRSTDFLTSLFKSRQTHDALKTLILSLQF